MSDIAKAIAIALLGAILSPVVTITTISYKVDMVKESVTKIETKLDKYDDRLREVELEQAKKPTYLAAN